MPLWLLIGVVNFPDLKARGSRGTGELLGFGQA